MTVQRKQKRCLTCQKDFVPTGNNCKFCPTCSKENGVSKRKERHKQTYVRKGYHQSKTSNNNWKGGIGIYRQLIATYSCSRCGSQKNLCVHHKDEDRQNNEVDNLECLCKKCHQRQHECWKSLPKKEELSLLKQAQAAIAKRADDGRFTK